MNVILEKANFEIVSIDKVNPDGLYPSIPIHIILSDKELCLITESEYGIMYDAAVRNNHKLDGYYICDKVNNCFYYNGVTAKLYMDKKFKYITCIYLVFYKLKDNYLLVYLQIQELLKYNSYRLIFDIGYHNLDTTNESIYKNISELISLCNSMET